MKKIIPILFICFIGCREAVNKIIPPPTLAVGQVWVDTLKYDKSSPDPFNWKPVFPENDTMTILEIRGDYVLYRGTCPKGIFQHEKEFIYCLSCGNHRIK